jgi:hypothetical protein
VQRAQQEVALRRISCQTRCAMFKTLNPKLWTLNPEGPATHFLPDPLRNFLVKPIHKRQASPA